MEYSPLFFLLLIDASDILREYWGYPSFRPLQREIIDSVLAGHDTLAILPTGGGKSLTYQVPSLILPGVTLVISPLIALMTDQVRSLRKRGIRAIVLHGGLSHNRVLDILEQAQFGAYDLIYLSPERLVSEFFRTRIQYVDVSLIAVDEAHCISQWGYDFRPPYLRIAEIRNYFPNAPVLALTASATKNVADDIEKFLSLPGCESSFKRFCQSIRRDNIVYVVRYTKDRYRTIDDILKAVPGTAIIYSRIRQMTEDIASVLCEIGYTADFYHAGLDRIAREERQQKWMNGQIRVLCATNAFGMGIDKPDVRVVIHFDIPDSLEAYYQEAGRAGRDGEKSYAVLLANDRSVDALLHRHEHIFPTKEYIRDVYQKLAEYYVIGAGSGLGAVFPFELEKFCHYARLRYSDVQSALQVLQWAGYITITDAMDDASKLQILLSPKDIFVWKQNQIDQDRILDSIMRRYTGIFTDTMHINEEIIADSLSITSTDVYNHLTSLASRGIVKYVPFRHTPLLIYETERKDSLLLEIPEDAYEQRINNLCERLKYMYNYVVSTQCRTSILARYFGEQDLSVCQHCDNCLTNLKSM